MGYIYRHIREDNGETFYIGISNSISFGYKRAYKAGDRNKLWKNIVEKTAYRVEILVDNISEEDTKEMEELLIKLYGRIDLKTGTLANLTDGGDGGSNPSEETKNKRKPFMGVKNRKPCISFDDGIEYESLKMACTLLNIDYQLEKRRVKHQSPLASLYYKGEYFEKRATRYKTISNNRSGKPVIHFETKIEYVTFREACRQLNLKYESERTATVEKYSTAKFYYKGFYFERATNEQIKENKKRLQKEKEDQGIYRGKKVVYVPTGVVYPNMRVACEVLELDLKKEKNKFYFKSSDFKYIE